MDYYTSFVNSFTFDLLQVQSPGLTYGYNC